MESMYTLGWSRQNKILKNSQIFCYGNAGHFSLYLNKLIHLAWNTSLIICLQWEVMPDLFFYRDPEEADKEERERLEAAEASKPEMAVPSKEDWGGDADDWAADAAAAPALAATAAAPAAASFQVCTQIPTLNYER